MKACYHKHHHRRTKQQRLLLNEKILITIFDPWQVRGFKRERCCLSVHHFSRPKPILQSSSLAAATLQRTGQTDRHPFVHLAKSDPFSLLPEALSSWSSWQPAPCCYLRSDTPASQEKMLGQYDLPTEQPAILLSENSRMSLISTHTEPSNSCCSYCIHNNISSQIRWGKRGIQHTATVA